MPPVIESFAFEETADGTRLSYSGELGTDIWRFGQAWVPVVRSWVDVVGDSMATIKIESERRAQGESRRRLLRRSAHALSATAPRPCCPPRSDTHLIVTQGGADLSGRGLATRAAVTQSGVACCSPTVFNGSVN